MTGRYGKKFSMDFMMSGAKGLSIPASFQKKAGGR
jgi:hypothetical protein